MVLGALPMPGSRVMTKEMIKDGNEQFGLTTLRNILLNRDLRRGYCEYWSGAPWPKDYSDNYEQGRLFAAELHGQGETRPPDIVLLKGRWSTREWSPRVHRCPSFEESITWPKRRRDDGSERL